MLFAAAAMAAAVVAVAESAVGRSVGLIRAASTDSQIHSRVVS